MFRKIILLVYALMFINIVGNPIAVEPTEISPPEGRHVLIVYNSNATRDDNGNKIPDSLEIVHYYQIARRIPNKNLCAIRSSTKEVVTKEEYLRDIKTVIEAYLERTALRNQIRYLVVTKGVPLKIIDQMPNSCKSTTRRRSVDGALCFLYQTDGNGVGRFPNPYFNVDPQYTLKHRFQSFHYASKYPLSYLVTRLDGYTVDDVKSMIDRSLNAYQFRRQKVIPVWYILDDHPTSIADRMPISHRVLTQRGENVRYDGTASYITTNDGLVMGYTSYGVHAKMPDGYITNTLKFQYANGALIMTYESFNAFGFQSPDQHRHGQVAEFIHAGGTGGIGNVAEPCLSGIAHEYILYAAYAAGYPLADACYMSLPFSNWTSVVVGDPLCRIR
ncbi:TPA: TIGR03790 family protein [Candidatus Poribacteria bacterium]|nr:TIGR03790 family protein [Candidatus Poribacteria bacterium]